jgi:hypothetical protein
MIIRSAFKKQSPVKCQGFPSQRMRMGVPWEPEGGDAVAKITSDIGLP